MYMQISANNIICSKQINIFSKLKLVHVIKMVIYILHMILKPYIYIAFTVRVTEPNLRTHTHHPNRNHARLKNNVAPLLRQLKVFPQNSIFLSVPNTYLQVTSSP